jgi:hypothetical protein
MTPLRAVFVALWLKEPNVENLSRVDVKIESNDAT